MQENRELVVVLGSNAEVEYEEGSGVLKGCREGNTDRVKWGG